MTNQERVLKYIKDFGSISPSEAVKDLGNYRLGSSIFELKKKGFNITSKTENCTTRYGNKTHYSRYFIEGE